MTDTPHGFRPFRGGGSAGLAGRGGDASPGNCEEEAGSLRALKA
jgi:hypothetical protein